MRRMCTNHKQITNQILLNAPLSIDTIDCINQLDTDLGWTLCPFRVQSN